MFIKTPIIENVRQLLSISLIVGITTWMHWKKQIKICSVKTYLFKSTITGLVVGIEATNLTLATSAARVIFGSLAYTWEGCAK